MKITIQPVFNSEANANTLRMMVKKFNENYQYGSKTRGLPRKEFLATVKDDIAKDYVFWIYADNKKIGYVLAPPTGRREDGEFTQYGRYLDTRFILPQYQGKGFGSRVLDILINEMNLVETCLHLDQIERYHQYYIDRGFVLIIPRSLVDETFQSELTNESPNPHVMVVHKNYAKIDLMKKELPHWDLITGDYTNPQKETA